MNSTNISNFFEFFPGLPSSSVNMYLNRNEVIAFVAFLGFFGFVGFLQNLVVILSIILTDGFLDAPANVFVLSLAGADLLVCGVSAPLLIYNCYHWIFTTFITVSKFIVVATTGNIFIMTFNRFVSIVRPLKYPKIITFKRAVFLVAMAWFLASSVPVMAIIGLTYKVKPMIHITRYFLAIYITSSSSMYVYMYFLARKQRANLRQLNYAVTGQMQTTLEEFKALRSLFMIAGSFAACWLPMTISFFFTDRSTDPVQFYRTFSYTAPLVVVNALLDPTIYYYRSKGFRYSLKLLVRRLQNSACW